MELSEVELIIETNNLPNNGKPSCSQHKTEGGPLVCATCLQKGEKEFITCHECKSKLHPSPHLLQDISTYIPTYQQARLKQTIEEYNSVSQYFKQQSKEITQIFDSNKKRLRDLFTDLGRRISHLLKTELRNQLKGEIKREYHILKLMEKVNNYVKDLDRRRKDIVNMTKDREIEKNFTNEIDNSEYLLRIIKENNELSNISSYMQFFHSNMRDKWSTDIHESAEDIQNDLIKKMIKSISQLGVQFNKLINQEIENTNSQMGEILARGPPSLSNSKIEKTMEIHHGLPEFNLENSNLYDNPQNHIKIHTSLNLKNIKIYANPTRLIQNSKLHIPKECDIIYSDGKLILNSWLPNESKSRSISGKDLSLKLTPDGELYEGIFDQAGELRGRIRKICNNGDIFEGNI